MESKFLRGLLGIALAVSATAALAQGFPNHRLAGTYAADGSGDVDSRQGDSNIRRATLRLDRDGDFTLRLDGNRDFSLSGNWTGRGTTNVVSLTVTNGFGTSRASGYGTATLGRDGILISLSIRGNNFRVSFDRRNDDWRDRPGRVDDWRRDNDRWNPRRNDDWGRGEGRITSMRESHSGRGTYRISDGRDYRITSAEVNLERDGDAIIRLRGEESVTFYGKWRGGRSNRAIITIQDASGHSDAVGSGHVVLDSREGYREFNFDGRFTHSGKRYNVNFVARR